MPASAAAVRHGLPPRLPAGTAAGLRRCGGRCRLLRDGVGGHCGCAAAHAVASFCWLRPMPGTRRLRCARRLPAEVVPCTEHVGAEQLDERERDQEDVEEEHHGVRGGRPEPDVGGLVLGQHRQRLHRFLAGADQHERQVEHPQRVQQPEQHGHQQRRLDQRQRDAPQAPYRPRRRRPWPPRRPPRG